MVTSVTIVEGGIELDRFEPIETVDTETDGLRIEKRVTRTESDRGIVDLTVRTTGEEVLGSWFVEPLPADVDPERVVARDTVDAERWSLTDEGDLEFEVVAVPGEGARAGYVATDVESMEELLEPPRVDEVQEMGTPASRPGTEVTGDEGGQPGESTAAEGDSLASKVREALSVSSESKAPEGREIAATPEASSEIDFEFTRGKAGDEGSAGVTATTNGTTPEKGDGEIDRRPAVSDADPGPEAMEGTTDGGSPPGATSPGDDTGEGASSESSTASGPGTTTAGTDAGETASDPARVTPDEVPTVFLAQLQSGALDDEDLAALREALGIERSRSETVRLQHVERRLTEFEAYIDALEAFIDDNGTADEVIADLESSVDSMSERLDRIEDDVQALDRRHEEVREALDEHDRRFSAVVDRLDGLESTVEELESTAEELESTTAAHDSRLAELADSQTETREQVDESVDEVRSDLEQVVDRIDSLESSWENLKAAFGGE